MEDVIAQEDLNACLVCHMALPDLSHAIVKRNGDAQDMLVFCSDECYKKYLENPDIYNPLQEEAME